MLSASIKKFRRIILSVKLVFWTVANILNWEEFMHKIIIWLDHITWQNLKKKKQQQQQPLLTEQSGREWKREREDNLDGK